MMVVNFLRILLWESLQNVGPIVGFMYATYQWMKAHKVISVMIVVLSMIVGSVAIQALEPLIYQEPVAFIWNVDLLLNAVVFTILGLLGVIYLDTQKDAKWDILISFICGAIVTASQALVSPYSALGIAAHGLSMSVSAYVFLRSARWAIENPKDEAVLGRAFLINIIGSAIIVVIDYGYLII